MADITTRVVRRARRRYGLTVLTHRQWGSTHRGVYAYRRKNKPVTRLKADTIVQHITVTNPSGDFAADVRTIERIGMDRFGSGVSYNFLVDMRTGKVAVGQPLDAKGTHTINDKDVPGFSYDQNLVARAIAVIGMPGTKLSDKAERSIAGLIAAMMDEGAATANPDYVPHSFFAWKDCPCDATRDRMRPILRRAKALRRRDEKPAPAPAPEPRYSPKHRAEKGIGTRVEIGRAFIRWASNIAHRAGDDARSEELREWLRTGPKS